MDKVKANRTWQGPKFLPCGQIPGERSLRGSPGPGGQSCRKPQDHPVRALAWMVQYNTESLNYTVCDPVFTEVYQSVPIWGLREGLLPPLRVAGRQLRTSPTAPRDSAGWWGFHSAAHMTSTTQHFSNSPSQAPLTKGWSKRAPGVRRVPTASIKYSVCV